MRKGWPEVGDEDRVAMAAFFVMAAALVLIVALVAIIVTSPASAFSEGVRTLGL